MTIKRYAYEFKSEEVFQITDRDDSVAEVSERLDVSTHSFYLWVKNLGSSDIRLAGLIKQLCLESCAVDVFHNSAASQ